MIHARLLVKTSLWLLIFLADAEAQVQQQQERQQRSQAEINVNKVESVRKLKFGDKIATQAPIQIKFGNFRLNDNNTRQRTDRIQYPNANRQTQQKLTQHEIPIVHKQRPTNVAESFDLHKGQQQSAMVSSQAVSERPENASNMQRPTMQYKKKRVNVVATPRNWSQKRAEELNATNTKVNAVERKQQKPYVSQRSSGLLTARPHSKKNAFTPTTIKSTSTTAATTTTTTTTTTLRPGFLQNNPFNIFSPQFWGFSTPTSTSRPTTKKSPKKYTTASRINQTPNEEKLKFQKLKVVERARTTVATTTPKPRTTKTAVKNYTTTDGPFRIALPTFSFFNGNPQTEKDLEREKEKRAIIASLREKFKCPRESEVRFQLFPKICKIDEDCSVWNREELCCDIFGSKSCVSGLPKPLEESSHAPILGLIPRKCPSRPLAELWWEVKECETDQDCWPRVCCPDGRHRYCRTSQPELETAPVQVKRSFDYLTEYLECTPPPPLIFDLHPKACTSTFDCFPNVCCQEAGLRHCRPPKKSVLTLMANFLNVDVVKRFAQNLVIK